MASGNKDIKTIQVSTRMWARLGNIKIAYNLKTMEEAMEYVFSKSKA
jgi:hypothetical protein